MQKKMYLMLHDMKRAGWCVYREETPTMISFHAGPFSEQAAAESEAKRLNDVVEEFVQAVEKVMLNGTGTGEKPVGLLSGKN